MKADALLATNTSSLSLETLSAGLARPERLIGIHFFNPVAKMPLVEVVHADGTAADTLARACAFVGPVSYTHLDGYKRQLAVGAVDIG